MSLFANDFSRNAAVGFSSTAFSANGFTAGAVQQAARATLTNLIAPTVKPAETKINTSAAGNIDPSGVGAAAQAQQAKAGIVAGMEAGQNTLNAGAAAIETAQRTIIAACEANGLQAGNVFPDTRMAPDSIAELGLSVVSGGGESFMGKGSMAQLASGALQVSDGVGKADDVLTGLKDRPVQEQVVAVMDTLQASAAPSPGQVGAITTVSTAPTLDKPSPLDWEAICEVPDALEKIMAFDGDFRHFPGLAELQTNMGEAAVAVADLTAIEERANIENPAMALGEIEAFRLAETTTPVAAIIDVDGIELDLSVEEETLVAITDGGAEEELTISALDRESELEKMARKALVESTHSPTPGSAFVA